MYIYKNEHNRQQIDDWLWDTIPNTYLVHLANEWLSPILVGSPNHHLERCSQEIILWMTILSVEKHQAFGPSMIIQLMDLLSST